MTYSDIIGTSQHENRKKQMKQYSAESYSYSDTIGSPLHLKRGKSKCVLFRQEKSKEEGTNVQNRVVKLVKM